MPEWPLSRIFADALAARGERVAAAPGPALEGALADAVDLAQRALPGVRVEAGEMVATIAEIVDGSAADLARAILEIRVADVALSRACGAGDAAALKLFEARFGRDLEAALRRSGATAQSQDELLQQLREKLLVAEPGQRPKIFDYAGRGELRNWLRAAAVRHALNFVTRGGREQPTEDELFAALPDGAGDPELLHAKRLYRAEFKAAFGEAVRALTPRERNLLRYAGVEQLSIDAIGALYGVHRATAARWLNAARERLLAGVQRRLAAQLGVGRAEIDSILRLVRSGLSVTMDRALEPEDDAGAR